MEWLLDSRLTEGLLDSGKEGFRSRNGYVYEIFTLKQLSEKMREKEQGVYLVLMNLEKAYDGVKMEIC